MKVLLFRAGHDLLSQAISAISRGQYVHAAILAEDDPAEPLAIFEAYYPKVRRRALRPDELPRVDAFDFAPALTPDQAAKFREFLVENIGDKYAVTDLFRFLPAIRAVIGDETNKGYADTKFCSGYVLGAALYAGVPLLSRCSPWEISPTTLSYSPLLTGPVLFPVFPAVRVAEPNSPAPQRGAATGAAILGAAAGLAMEASA